MDYLPTKILKNTSTNFLTSPIGNNASGVTSKKFNEQQKVSEKPELTKVNSVMHSDLASFD